MISLGTAEGDLSLKAKSALDESSKILARTSLTESFKNLSDYEVETLDYLFESCRNFDSLNKKLAAAVLAAAKLSDVCYCVDGGVGEDEASKIILKKHKDTVVCEGVTKSAHAAALANISSPYVSVSAYGVQQLKSCRAAIVYDIDGFIQADRVKQTLSFLFGEETECSFIRGDSVKKIKIYEIDRQKEYDYSCAVAVQEAEFLKKDRYDYADLEEIIRILRKPDGCPWDRVQTNESIRKNLIEEAYELVDAIERDDDDGIEEETGDVLLQAAFQSVLKEEQSVFSGGDAITRVVKKLIFRHSHIFGNDRAGDEQSALSVWEKNKNVEKSMTNFSQQLEAVPKNFPACMRAQKVQKRAAKSGMDFLSAVSAADKLGEEVAELLNALVNGKENEVLDEAGDVLFSAINCCRLAGVDCEEALRLSVDKFIKRFSECERQIIADGKNITDLNELELDWYWLRAKNALKAD